MKATILLTVAALVGACSSSTNDRSSLDERQERIQDQRAEAEPDHEGHERLTARSSPDVVDNDPDAVDNDGDNDKKSSALDSDGNREPDRIAEADEANVAADNTERNERDQNSSSLTPLDQSNSSSDIEITQQIRKKVIDNDDLSFNAKNVKIITVAGKVTLRGPVRNGRKVGDRELGARVRGCSRRHKLEV